MGFEECDAEEEEREQAAYDAIGPQWTHDHADELFEENYGVAVEQFTNERLNAYYVAHPGLEEPALTALSYAKSLEAEHPTAALVFAAASIEIVLIELVLKPLVFGLVHAKGMETMILKLLRKSNGIRSQIQLLDPLLKQYGEIDLHTYKRPMSNRSLYVEIDDVQDRRNKVLHNGKMAKNEESSLALVLAETLLSEVYPRLRQKLSSY